MGTSQGSSPDYFKGQSHILFKARTTWTWGQLLITFLPVRFTFEEVHLKRNGHTKVIENGGRVIRNLVNS